MFKYWLVYKIGILDILEYKFDFVLNTAKYSLMLIVLAFVWLAANQNGATGLSPNQTFSYFFWAAVLYSLSNFHTYYIEDDIRLGTLGKYLLKPISPFLYYLSHQLAKASMETSFKFIVLVPLLSVLGFQWQLDLSRYFLLLAFLPLIFLFSFNVLSSISSLSFWLTEAWALRWSATILIRFLAGILVPISFLPTWFQTWSWWLPFQHLAYTPIQLILGNMAITSAVHGWLILAGWTLATFWLRHIIWVKGLSNYENIGI